MKLYSVRDFKAEAFNPPFACETEAQAVRSFEHEVRYGQGMPSKFPSDFALFYVGEFDPVTGSVEPALQSRVVGGEAFKGGEDAS